MATSVLLSCGLAERKLPPILSIQHSSGSDGRFLVSCLLGHQSKIPDSGIILVCLDQLSEHYINAGLKLGYNLNSGIEKGSVRVIDVIGDLFTQFPISQFSKNHQPETIITQLWMMIQSNLENLLSIKSQITIIIDNLTCLSYLGVGENLLIKFCERLRNLTVEHPKVSIVVKANCVDLFEILPAKLDDLSNVNIKVKGLESGNFQEVDGKLIIKRNIANLTDIVPEKIVLYKLNERNIKTYAPGEFGVKI